MTRGKLIAIGLLLPVLASGAESARQELARALALTPDAQRGSELFAQCASCHGAGGEGVMAGTTPRIAGQHYGVLVRQLVDFRRGKRWDFQMEGVATSHDVIPELQDVADVAAYVSQLSRDGVRGIGDGQFLEQGAKIYEEACASCHGPAGEGNDARAIPRIAGQHAGYLSRQMYDAVDGRRPQLTRTHRARLAKLEFTDVRGLADHIARMGTSGQEAPANAGSPPTH
jgi:cytochrome c553